MPYRGGCVGYGIFMIIMIIEINVFLHKNKVG